MTTELGNKIANGYYWNLLSRWLTRCSGLVSSLILVRLLAPSDFGVVALATIFVTFFVVILDAGTEKYVIRADSFNDAVMDNAWSLNIALKLACGLVIASLSGVLSRYVDEPSLTNVLLVTSLLPVIGSMKNIGMAKFERELNYKVVAKLNTSVKLLSIPVTVFLALTLKNYWALIVGLLVGEVLMVLGSYLLSPYRPKWRTDRWKEQWSFSKWHLITVTTGYFRSRIDAVLLGKYLGSTDIGVYRISQEFSWLPFTELISPATQSVYSGLTYARDDKSARDGLIIRYLALSYLLVMPATILMYVLSEQFTRVVLGQKWLDAAPVIGMLSILMLSMPLNTSLQSLLTNLSRMRPLVVIDALMILMMVSIIYSLVEENSLDLTAYIHYRVMLVFAFISLLLYVYRRVVGVPISSILPCIILPALPAVTMGYCVHVFHQALSIPVFFEFLVLGVFGVVMYAILMLVVMYLTKNICPEYGVIYERVLYFRKKMFSVDGK